MSLHFNSLRVVLIFNGRRTEGQRGVVFEGEKRPTRVKVNSTIEELYQKIRQKLALKENQRITMIHARIWCEEQYTSMQVVDDEDVEMVIGEFFKQLRKDFLEMYIDIGGAEDVLLPTRSVAFNSPHASSSAAPVVNLSVEDEHDPTWVMDEDDDDDDDDDEEITMEEERLLADNASDSDNDDEHGLPTTQIQQYHHVAESHVREHRDMIPAPLPQYSEGDSLTPFWEGIPYYTYIDWNHPSEQDSYTDGSASVEGP